MNKVCELCTSYYWAGGLAEFSYDIRKISFKSDIRIDMKLYECDTCNEKKIFFYYKKIWKKLVFISKDININIEKKEDVILILNESRAFLYEKKINGIYVFINFYLDMDSHYLIEIGKAYSKEKNIKIKDIIYMSSEVSKKMKEDYFYCFYKTKENENIFKND